VSGGRNNRASQEGTLTAGMVADGGEERKKREYG